MQSYCMVPAARLLICHFLFTITNIQSPKALVNTLQMEMCSILFTLTRSLIENQLFADLFLTNTPPRQKVFGPFLLPDRQRHITDYPVGVVFGQFLVY